MCKMSYGKGDEHSTIVYWKVTYEPLLVAICEDFENGDNYSMVLKADRLAAYLSKPLHDYFFNLCSSITDQSTGLHMVTWLLNLRGFFTADQGQV